MQVIDCEQGTPEWLALRCGIVTMSEIGSLMVKGKGAKGLGSGALTYMHKLIGERIVGEPGGSFGGNCHTERGHELEPRARELYCEQTGNELKQTGIILNHDCGYSPDSLSGDSGLVEIKTKLAHLQVEVILADELPAEHLHQCQGGLWISEREWLDFISYCPGMPLFVKRVYRDEALISQYRERVAIFYEELDIRMQKVLGIDLGLAA